MMVQNGAIRIFGLQKLATVGTRGLHGTALAPRMTRLTRGRSGAEGHFTPCGAKHSHQPLVVIVMISTIISQCDNGDDVNPGTIINHSLAEYLQPAKQMIQFGASHCGKAKLRSSYALLHQWYILLMPSKLKCFFGGKYPRLESLREGSHIRVFVTHLSPP